MFALFIIATDFIHDTYTDLGKGGSNMMLQHNALGLHLKMILLCCFIASVTILSPLYVNSAVVGDINHDGKIDLMESIYALQVASGIYPTIDDSCLLTGQGVWEDGKDYNLCDVVTSSEITYACNTAHSAIDDINGPPDTAYWTVLSIKGETGPPGANGITSETDPTVPASVKDGISWSEVSSIPAGFADNIDNDSGGDITNVTAGTGLTGGGSSGGVTLSHSNTSSQASANNSSGSVIQDITLDTYGHLTGMVSTNLDSRYYTETEANSNYVNVSGDSMTGNLSIVGAVLKISPTGGTAVLSNVMRTSNTSVPTSGDITNTGDLFLSNDLEVGGQIYASKDLYMNGNNTTGDDGDQAIFFYNGGSQTGASIKWNDFEGRFDLSTHAKINGHLRVTENVIVTEDVDVAGSVFMGYERVVGSAVTISTNVGNCTILGTSNCYYDDATATCPVGKVVIGGGCNSNASAATVIVDNYPSSTTTWRCDAYSSQSNGSLTPYALCARMAN